MIEGCFTVTFEDPFWVGIFERYDERGYSAAKIIFGSEPNAEIIRLAVLQQYRSLKFSEPIPERPVQAHEVSYKRRQRELKHMLDHGEGQREEVSEALATERKRQELERKQREKAEREAEEAHKLEIRLERKKEKKKGH